MWRNLFFIISLEKSILLLNIFVCNVKDHPMIFARAVTALFSPILWKADAKLLKQQLVDNFWWYFSTGDSGWNTIFCYFCITIWDYKKLTFFHLLTPNICLIKFFYRNPVHVSWIFFLTTHDQYQTIVLILRIDLGSYISLSFTFHFYYHNPFDGSWSLMHIILVQ